MTDFNRDELRYLIDLVADYRRDKCITKVTKQTDCDVCPRRYSRCMYLLIESKFRVLLNDLEDNIFETENI